MKLTFSLIISICLNNISFLNAGQEWTFVSNCGNMLSSDIAFADDNNGTVIGFDFISFTSDGGLSWNKLRPGALNYSDIIFTGTDTGYMTGSNPAFLSGLYKTTNKGIDWYLVFQTSQGGVFRFLNSLKGYYCDKNGNIFHSNDGGLTWISLNNVLNVNPVSMSFSNVENGIIIDSEGRGFKTFNGGINWNRIFLKTGYSSGVDYADEEAAFVLTYNPEIIAEVVRKTTDGGNNWTSVYFDRYKITDIHFLNKDTGYICGTNGTIKLTTNCGNNWISQSDGLINFFVAMYITGFENGWLLDSEGNVYRKQSNKRINLGLPFK